MVIGVEFTVQQVNNGNALWQLAKCLDDDLNIYIVDNQTEVFHNREPNRYFECTCYTMSNFLQHTQLPHYATFCKMQAYKGVYQFYDIHTYEDFINSDCCLLLLLYDCENVEIFVKDENLANDIFHRANSEFFLKKNYIYKEDSNRTVMDIL